MTLMLKQLMLFAGLCNALTVLLAPLYQPAHAHHGHNGHKGHGVDSHARMARSMLHGELHAACNIPSPCTTNLADLFLTICSTRLFADGVDVDRLRNGGV
jgi:hypothetical protein